MKYKLGILSNLYIDFCEGIIVNDQEYQTLMFEPNKVVSLQYDLDMNETEVDVSNEFYSSYWFITLIFGRIEEYI